MAPEETTCLEANELLEFLGGLLTARRSEEVELHLDRCPACRRIMASVVLSSPLPTDAPEVEAPAELQLDARVPDEDELPPGQRIDHFIVLRYIGGGAMGRVYLAQDIRLGRKVALKVLRAPSASNQSMMERFLDEAKTTAQFNHPNIVTIYDVGAHQLRPYLALEYLDGQTLDERARRQGFSVPEVLRLGRAAAAALSEAHRHGILHRDLKPSNVMLDREGRIKVLDFGLAQAGSPSSKKTMICGTPGYWAPELWRGRAATPASDIWSLGVVLYELLAGQRPYRAADARELRKACTSDDPVPSVDQQVPVQDALSRLVSSCLEKDPDQRPTANELVQRFQRLLEGDVVRPQQETVPFLGLASFHEEQRHLFFGREEETAAISERLRGETFLALVGPSGAGKSSLVQAGVIPRLRERGPLSVIQLRPGSHPFATLAARLSAELHRDTDASSVSPFGNLDLPFVELAPSLDVLEDRDDASHQKHPVDDGADLAHRLRTAPGLLNLMLRRVAARRRSSVLLFVDQLEELFTLVEDAESHAFIRAISAAADDPQVPVRVLCTLREEFLSRLASSREARAAFERVALVRPPSSSALQEILQRPAEAAGYSYDDPNLVQEMVSEVAEENARLPMLAFAGQMLWDQRDRQRRLLRRTAYEAMGGVAGALAHHADSLLAGLTASEVRGARVILLRLVTPDGTRRILSRSELLEGLGESAGAILDRLMAARLVVPSQSEPGEEPLLELVHEALVDAWVRLRRWIDESREELVLLEEIGRAAELWRRRGQRDDALWQGDSLRDAQRLLVTCSTEVPERVVQFIEAGLRRQRQAASRKRLLITAAFAVLAAVAVVFALKEQETRREQVRAVRLKAEADREGARAALMRGELVEARAKLRSSLEVQDSPLGRALFWRLSREPLHWSKELGSNAYSITFSPDGRSLAAAGRDKTIYIFDIRTQAVRFLRGHADQVITVAYSPDGQLLASGDWGGQVHLWDLRRGTSRVLGRHKDRVWSVAFSPDGRLLASGSQDSIRLWDVATGAQQRSLTASLSRFGGVAFSPRGDQLAAGCRDGVVRIWDVGSGRLSRTLRGHQIDVRGVSYAPDGRYLASGSSDRTVRVWDPRTGRQVHLLRGHSAGVRHVAFAPDGRTLASGSLDNTVRVWDAATGRQTRQFADHTGAIYSVAFSPDGRLLASADFAKVVRVRNLATRPAQGVRGGSHSSFIYAVSFSPDGTVVASAGQDKTVRIWETKSGTLRRVLRSPRAAFGVAFSPDGNLLATGTGNGLTLYNAGSGTIHKELRGHGSGIVSVAFSADGRMLISGGDDHTARVWEVKSGRTVHLLEGHSDALLAVTLSPDGRMAASASRDRTARIWDLDDGSVRHVLTEHQAGVHGVGFSTDGKRLFTSGEDGTVRVWDVNTGRGSVVGRHPSRAYNLGVHPNGTVVGCPGSDAVARLWEIGTGKHRELRGHRNEVNNLKFSSDGRLVATSSDDETVRLWDFVTGRPHWRAPVLLRQGPELLTHRGWESLTRTAKPAARASWREALVDRTRFAIEAEHSPLLCVQTHDEGLEIWDKRSDRLLIRRAVPGIRQLAAFPGGCLTLAVSAAGPGQARLHERSGSSRILGKDASAVTWDRGRVLVASRRKVLAVDQTGRPITDYDCDPGVQAMVHVGDWLALGNKDGNIDLVPVNAGTSRPTFAFEGVPSSPVVAMREGPTGTLIVGYANGVIGVWSVANGVRLHHARLHGPVVHLLLQGSKLYAASELGDHLVMDLGVFDLSYCKLMKRVWRSIPVVWEGGLPVLRLAPKEHRCQPAAP